MASKYSMSYYKYRIPLEQILLSYNEKFLGKTVRSYETNAALISLAIDNYLDPNIGFDLNSIRSNLKSFLIQNGNSHEYCIWLLEKYYAAQVIMLLRSICDIQNRIEDKRKMPVELYKSCTSLMNDVTFSYSEVPECLFLELKSSTLELGNLLKSSQEHNLSDYFNTRIYTPAYESTKHYFGGLFYEKSTAVKANEFAFDALMKISCFVVFCVLFSILAKCTCN